MTLYNFGKYGRPNITYITLKTFSQTYRHLLEVIDKGWQFLLTHSAHDFISI